MSISPRPEDSGIVGKALLWRIERADHHAGTCVASISKRAPWSPSRPS